MKIILYILIGLLYISLVYAGNIGYIFNREPENGSIISWNSYSKLNFTFADTDAESGIHENDIYIRGFEYGMIDYMTYCGSTPHPCSEHQAGGFLECVSAGCVWTLRSKCIGTHDPCSTYDLDRNVCIDHSCEPRFAEELHALKHVYYNQTNGTVIEKNWTYSPFQDNQSIYTVLIYHFDNMSYINLTCDDPLCPPITQDLAPGGNENCITLRDWTNDLGFGSDATILWSDGSCGFFNSVLNVNGKYAISGGSTRMIVNLPNTGELKSTTPNGNMTLQMRFAGTEPYIEQYLYQRSVLDAGWQRGIRMKIFTDGTWGLIGLEAGGGTTHIINSTTVLEDHGAGLDKDPDLLTWTTQTTDTINESYCIYTNNIFEGCAEYNSYNTVIPNVHRIGSNSTLFEINGAIDDFTILGVTLTHSQINDTYTRKIGTHQWKVNLIDLYNTLHNDSIEWWNINVTEIETGQICDSSGCNIDCSENPEFTINQNMSGVNMNFTGSGFAYIKSNYDDIGNLSVTGYCLLCIETGRLFD